MRRLLALLSLALAAVGAVDLGQLTSQTDDMVSLLQTRADLHGTSPSSRNTSEECGYLVGGHPDYATFMNNNGRFHSHGADFNRSVVEVMAEHPGVDGYCYFDDAAMYIKYEPGPHDYVAKARAGVIGLAKMQSLPLSNPRVTYHWEGPPVQTRLHRFHYVYDDIYAYALGFLQGQGIDTALLFNNTAWEELSAQKCAELQREYNFQDDELILNDVLDANLAILAECSCAAGIYPVGILDAPGVRERSGYKWPLDCRPITRRELAKHHYFKCVLGYKNSADDMAYLHARACLLEGNRIGHAEECPYNVLG